MLTWSDQASTPVQALSCQDTLPFVPLAAVGTEHVSDLSAADTDITGGHVSVGADVLAQSRHEGAAELANLAITLALGVEVGTSFTSTHVHYTKRQVSIYMVCIR